MMTKLQREDLERDMEHMRRDWDEWKPLNVRQEKEWPWWTGIVMWIVIWFLLAVILVFVFDKIEGLARVKFPNL